MINLTNELNVKYHDHMGDDDRVIEAARVSVGKEDIAQNRREGLIRYLVSEDHTSTLEHCYVTFSVDVPIFVAREWMRHRTQSFNEISGRYSKLDLKFYLPDENRGMVNAGSSARPDIQSNPELAKKAQAIHEWAYKIAAEAYQEMIDLGVAKEVARNVLPVGTYTRLYATANLNNWFKFLYLRNGEKGHPQEEIVIAAKQVEKVIGELFPVTYDAWKAKMERYKDA